MADFPYVPQLQFPSYGTGAAGGIGMVNQFAEVQNRLNQAKLFNQTFAARQLMGQIFATSPDTDSAFESIMHSPAAPFATEALNSYRQMENTLVDMQGKMLGQSQSALQSLLKSMPAAIADPSVLPGLVKANLATLPPNARVAPQVREAYNDVITSLTGGLPTDAAAASTQFRNRLYGLSLAGGVTPEVLAGVVGTPQMVDLGNQKVPVVMNPAIAGPGMQVGGAGLGMGLAPQIFEPSKGGIPVGGVYGSGMPMQPPMANAPPAGSAQVGPLSLSPPQGPIGQTPSGGQRIAGDGTPLLTDNMVSPSLGKGIGGVNILSDQQKETAKTLSDEFNNSATKAYDNAVSSRASFVEMRSNLDRLLQGGGPGFLAPGGLGANLRADIAKSINTGAQVLGLEPPFDPQKITSIEDMQKLTKRLGISTLTQMLGNQREAALTIQGITQAVPSFENSAMGLRFITAMLDAGSQRVIDQHEFQRAWASDPRNQGNLTGSIEAFNQAHPATQYIHSALDGIGLNEKGFKSAEDIKDAVRKGYLTKEQGIKQYDLQFPQGHEAPATQAPQGPGGMTPSGTIDQIQ